MQSKKLLITLLVTCDIVSACGGSQTASNNTDGPKNLSVRLQIRDSLTGDRADSGNRHIANKIADVALQNVALKKRGGTGAPCTFLGHDDKDDPFRNGYETSRFLISTMATWTCVADLLIDLSMVVAHDGVVLETDNDTLAVDYEADDPTHFSITDDSNTQVTLRMYYGYARALPLLPTEESQFYISWNQQSQDVVEGKMVINVSVIDQQIIDPNNPSMMRMDFDFDKDQRSADMFLRFDDNNAWADGFRIQVKKDLNASPLTQVFTAHGLINMSAQFFPVAGISETPDIQFYTVADLLGNGVTIEEVQDFSLPLLLNFFLNNHLGDYLFSKRDIYFFEHDRDWEYINKIVTSSEYRGSRNTPATGGSWLPFDPSIDLIKTALTLPANYFNGNQCADIGDDCNQLLNSIFGDGFAGQEQNQGSDPMDWRSIAIDNADYLTSTFPNGIDWEGAFVHSFTPSL
ncbi:MAG: hypothetical protein ACI9KN_000144 [Gammaproteobacteria bacterium]|jgi:hypothetical protein